GEKVTQNCVDPPGAISALVIGASSVYAAPTGAAAVYVAGISPQLLTVIHDVSIAPTAVMPVIPNVATESAETQADTPIPSSRIACDIDLSAVEPANSILSLHDPLAVRRQHIVRH